MSTAQDVCAVSLHVTPLTYLEHLVVVLFCFLFATTGIYGVDCEGGHLSD